MYCPVGIQYKPSTARARLLANPPQISMPTAILRGYQQLQCHHVLSRLSHSAQFGSEHLRIAGLFCRAEEPSEQEVLKSPLNNDHAKSLAIEGRFGFAISESQPVVRKS
jgi:hypothetical protein